MKRIPFRFILPLLVFGFAGCADTTSSKIRESLLTYNKGNVLEPASIKIDSITYQLEDSTIYYNHFLQLLEEKSESFSRMAKLRIQLAQSHMNNFLSGDKNSAERSKSNVDKSLYDLKQNEREWDAVNDSMDLMLNSVHNTDILKKVFYYVSFSLKKISGNKTIIDKRKALLNRDDFKVVIVE